MKKINLTERFQQLAGIKSLPKLETKEIGTEDLNEAEKCGKKSCTCSDGTKYFCTRTSHSEPDCKCCSESNCDAARDLLDGGKVSGSGKGKGKIQLSKISNKKIKKGKKKKPSDTGTGPTNPNSSKNEQILNVVKQAIRESRSKNLNLREEKECSTNNNVGAQGGQNHVDCGGNGKTCNHFGECVPMANLGSSGKTTNKKNPFDTGTGPTNPDNEYEKYSNLIKQVIKELEDDETPTIGGTILTEKQTCAETATAGFADCDANDDADVNFDFDGCVQGVFSAYSACKAAGGGSMGLPQDNTNYKDLTKVNPTNPTGKSIPLPKRRNEYNY
tara:strand:+ start:772 stop:1761 length:990 start_codon:yes stop_codon:yes gene_type:complete